MLVSKIKPSTSQYKHSHGETANDSLKQLKFFDGRCDMDNCGNSRANTRSSPTSQKGCVY